MLADVCLRYAPNKPETYGVVICNCTATAAATRIYMYVCSRHVILSLYMRVQPPLTRIEHVLISTNWQEMYVQQIHLFHFM